jgi:hypothetical protein
MYRDWQQSSISRRYFGKDLTNVDSIIDTHNVKQVAVNGLSNMEKYRNVDDVINNELECWPSKNDHDQYAHTRPVNHNRYQSYDSHADRYSNGMSEEIPDENIVPVRYENKGVRKSTKMYAAQTKITNVYYRVPPQQPIDLPKLHTDMLSNCDSVYCFSKQMHFPGSYFRSVDGLPISAIWSHLIFSKVSFIYVVGQPVPVRLSCQAA